MGRYWRSKGENTYPLTNFIFEPIEMIESEEETQLTADLVTTRGETFRLTFMTTDFANQQKFKNLLNKNTIALTYLGGDGDLELLKAFVSELKWEKKRSTKLSNLPTACIHRIQKSRYTSLWADTGVQRVRIHIR